MALFTENFAMARLLDILRSIEAPIISSIISAKTPGYVT